MPAQLRRSGDIVRLERSCFIWILKHHNGGKTSLVHPRV